MAGVWGASKGWGTAAASSEADRARLPKGSEPCHICGEDSMVEVKCELLAAREALDGALGGPMAT